MKILHLINYSTPSVLIVALFSLWLSFSANAYEDEDAVPLTISAQPNDRTISKVSILLNGRIVSISNELDNRSNIIKRVGFSAHTPFFSQLGEGETHQDKTFSDLAVTFNSKKITPTVYRRGFFLGQDITEKLVKAGIDPLPDNDIDTKKLAVRGLRLDDWQGYVAYSWLLDLLPHSHNESSISYRALPEFGLDSISSDHFSRQVIQHCGNPDEVRRYLDKLNAGSDEIIFERYQIPIMYLPSLSDVQIEVFEPHKNWLNAEPVITLLCGISRIGGDQLHISRTISEPGKDISVLVIAKPEGL